MFLVGIDFEMFALARSLVGDGLFGQIHFHFHLRIGRDRVEQLFQERLTYHHRKHKVVQFIVLVYIGKEARYHHTKTVTGNGPCSMLTAGTGTEVLSRHQNLSTVSGIVQNKVLVQRTVRMIAPIAE